MLKNNNKGLILIIPIQMVMDYLMDGRSIMASILILLGMPMQTPMVTV